MGVELAIGALALGLIGTGTQAYGSKRAGDAAENEAKREAKRQATLQEEAKNKLAGEEATTSARMARARQRLLMGDGKGGFGTVFSDQNAVSGSYAPKTLLGQ